MSDWLAAVHFVVNLLGLQSLGIMLNQVVGVAYFGLMIAGFWAWRLDIKGAGYYTIAWACFALGALTYPLSDNGLLSNDFLAEWAGHLGTLLEMTFLTIALGARARDYRAAQDREKQDFLQQIISARDQLEQRVDERTEELEQAKRQAEEDARTDPLTGVANRRSFMERAQEELARYERYNRPLSLLIFDIDYFKRINDKYGHDGGDVVLIDFARELNVSARSVDLFARLGGEEFAMLLVDADATMARQAADRALALVRGMKVSYDTHTIELTTSIGIGTYGDSDVDFDRFMNRVDQTLYQAKEQGRDRVVVSAPREKNS